MDHSPETATPHEEVAGLIRQCSETGRLMKEDEILVYACQHGLLSCPEDERTEAVKCLLDTVLETNEDVCALVARDGSRRLYSTQFMTEAYAVILCRKTEDPVQLIAEIVRQNSRVYPRPVPLDLFVRPPFDLAEQEIMEYVKQMAADASYGDIAMIASSTSREFLYSRSYLEPDHASLLAEWLDVGQANNP